jgi:hypothetical protein
VLHDNPDAHDVGPDEQLVFAPRGVEHVRSDDNCCLHPGDSLRWIPADGSVTRGRD